MKPYNSLRWIKLNEFLMWINYDRKRRSLHSRLVELLEILKNVIKYLKHSFENEPPEKASKVSIESFLFLNPVKSRPVPCKDAQVNLICERKLIWLSTCCWATRVYKLLLHSCFLFPNVANFYAATFPKSFSSNVIKKHLSICSNSL